MPEPMFNRKGERLTELLGWTDPRPITADVIYSQEEWEFILAVYNWRKSHNHRMPDCRDILEIAKSLGYAKPDNPGGEPG